MLPLELRFEPELSFAPDSLVFRFDPDTVSEDSLLRALGQLIDHISEDSVPPRQVIVDLRNSGVLEPAVVGKLSSLNQRLQSANWTLGLAVDRPSQEALRAVHVNGSLSIIGEHRFDDIVEENKMLRQSTTPGEGAIGFTQEELDKMLADGITLDDAIASIERSGE
jgi:hypothetical protein